MIWINRFYDIFFFTTFVRFLLVERIGKIKIEDTKMKKIVIYGLSVMGLLLTSCLGDPATSLTMALQPAVVQLEPVKVLCVKGGDKISSTDFQKKSVADGECFLVDYSIDMGAAENAEGGKANGYYTAIIGPYTNVSKWPLFTNLTDTLGVEPNELSVSVVHDRRAYIQGEFFLFTDLAGHLESQVDSFSLSYNPDQAMVGDSRIYDLYLRVMKVKEGQEQTEATLFTANAFHLEDFVNEASAKETPDKDGKRTVNFRINYVSGFNSDTTQCIWKSSNVFTIDVLNQAQ